MISSCPIISVAQRYKDNAMGIHWNRHVISGIRGSKRLGLRLEDRSTGKHACRMSLSANVNTDYLDVALCRTSYLFYVLWSGAIAGLASWLVKSFSRYAAGSGVPEIKTI